MPYTKDNAPAAVKKLPDGAQKIWLAAYNNASKEYKGDEAKAFATAWTAVKTKYEQDDKGDWHLKKKGRGMDEEQASLPMLTRAGASFVPSTVNEADRTVEVVWTTGATVRRSGFFTDPFDEQLLTDDENVDLSRLNSGANLLDSHNAVGVRNILGAVVPGSAKLMGPKGRREGRALVRFSPRAEDVWLDVKGGIIRNVSAGYAVQQWDRVDRRNDVPLMRAALWTPYELSLCAINADAASQVRSSDDGDLFSCTIVHRSEEIDPMSTAATRAAEGAADKRPAKEQERIDDNQGGNEQPVVQPQTQPAAQEPVEGQPPVTQPGQQPPANPQPAVDPVTDGNRAADPVLLERQRIEGVHAAVDSLFRGQQSPEDRQFVSGLISGGVPLQEARYRIMERAMERMAPFQVNGGHPGHVGTPRGGQDETETLHRGVQEILAYRMGSPGAQIGHNSAGARFVNMSLVEMGRDLLREAGVNVRGMSKAEIADRLLLPGYGVRSVNYGRLLTRDADGGLMSTSDFVTSLGNSVQRRLREAYEATPQTFQAWATRGTLPDFRAQSLIGLSGAPALEPVIEDGEFKRGVLTETGEFIALGTFGKIMGVTRQLVINDDIGLVARIAVAYGQAGRNLESDVVYAQILANPVLADGVAFFHANHGNVSGAGTGITIANVGAARLAMWLQTDPAGQAINVEPRILLVPPALGMTAEQLYAPFVATAPTGALPESLRMIQPVVERRLQTGITIGRSTYAGSAANWYVLAAQSPGVTVVQYAYLEGQEGLFTEQRVGFDIDGVEFKARLDFGAKAVDPRGAFKSLG
jgi:cation transport regulator ChaB